MTHAGVRVPMVAGFAAAAAGLLLLSAADVGGSYLSDLLPGMLVAGVGLGLVLVSVSVSVMTGAADDETGMLVRAEHDRPRDRRVDRHRRRGHHRRRLDRPDAPHGIGDAFLALAGLAGLAGLAALVVIPAAATFLPKLRLAPRVAIH